MKYQKRQEWKKKALAVVALLMAAIMVLSMIAPFTVFAASVFVTSQTGGALELPAENTPVVAKEIGEERFQGTFSAGYDDNYIVTQDMPIHGVITNLGENFQGEVQVKAYARNMREAKEYIVYYQKIELGQGASKTIDMEVALGGIYKNLELSLVDETGTTVYLKNLPLKAKEPVTVMIGILTERKEPMNYMKDLHLAEVDDGYGGRVKNGNYELITFLDEKTFPDSGGLISSFDTIIIEDFDTSILRQEQKDALTRWVNDGGTLVVGTGVNGKKTLKGLDLLQDVSIAGTKEVSDVFQTGGAVSLAEISGGSLTPFVESAGAFSYQNAGQGHIILAHFALSLAPATGNAEVNRRMEEAIIALSGERFIEETDMSNGEYDSLSNVARQFPALEMNAISLIMGLVVVYILVVGPILYLVLKKKDRREQGWVIIPIVSVVFMAAAFFLAQGSGYKNGMLRTVSAVEMTGDSPVAMAEVGIAVKSAESGNITFTSTDQLFLRMNYDNYYYAEEVPNKERNTHRILSGDTTEVTFLDSPSWATQYMRTQVPTDMGGTVESTIALTEDGYAGQLVNNTNLDFIDVSLVLNGTVYRIQDFAAGETEEISLTAKEISEMPWDPYGGNFQSEIQFAVSSGEMSRNEAFVKFNQETLRNEYLSEYTNEQRFQDSVAIQFFGFTETSPLLGEQGINGARFQESNMGMYHKELPIVLSVDQAFSLSLLGQIDSEQKIEVNDQGQIQVVYAVEESEVAVDFRIPGAAPVDTISMTYPVLAEGAMQQEVAAFFNHETGVWDEITGQEILPARAYVDGNGAVSMKFTLKMGEGRQVPQLKITGGEQGAGN